MMTRHEALYKKGQVISEQDAELSG
jgi:hypothetical protein